MERIAKEEQQAAKALIAWLQSQDISPSEAIPIMARAMVVACVSLVSRDREGPATAKDIREAGLQVRSAGRLIPETFAWMLEYERD